MAPGRSRMTDEFGHDWGLEDHEMKFMAVFLLKLSKNFNII